MADVTVTAGNVVPAAGYQFTDGVAGATIGAGQTVYSDAAASNTIKLADNNASTATKACVGIAVNSAASGQPVRYMHGGTLAFGAVLTLGTAYAVSSNAGGICPVADWGAGHYRVTLGIATSTSNLAVKVHNSGVTD